MEREAVYNPNTNGSRSSTGYKPYAGPTLLTAGSAGIMERESAYNSMTNGAKSGATYKPYTGPTLLTAGSTGIMERETVYNPNTNGSKFLSGKKLSLGSKILPIAKKSVNMVVDNIEDPQYRAVAKQIVKKSGAGLYGKAGSGLTGKGLSGSGLSGSGLSGQGLSGSGMRKRYPAVVRREFDEEDFERMKISPDQGRNVIKPYPRRMPRFEKGLKKQKIICPLFVITNKVVVFFQNLEKK